MIPYQRILIIGSPGSGKSTFSKKLGNLTLLPVIHLDKEYWLPNWTVPDKNEWYQKLSSIIALDKWIIDGTYGDTLDLRLSRADLVIFLDYKKMLCVNSVIKRELQRKNKKRDDMANGCAEKLDFKFLNWVWKFPKIYRPKILSILEHHPNVKVITFKSRLESKKYLEEVIRNNEKI